MTDSDCLCPTALLPPSVSPYEREHTHLNGFEKVRCWLKGCCPHKRRQFAGDEKIQEVSE